MKKLLVYARIYLLVGLLLALTIPAQAVSWNAAITQGLTSVDVLWDPPASTYTWTLNNLSGTPDCPYPDETVLVWSLQPFNVREPAATTPPPGWTWDDSSGAWQCYEIENEPDKYYTPPAIEPGGSLTFIYVCDPSGSMINPFPPDYEGDPINDIGFISHVAAVVPRTEPIDYNLPWVPAESQYGDTWYDRSDYTTTVVPEPASATALGAFGIPLVLAFLRRRRS
ncbi:MAG TPA: hypothetical protein VMX94_09020 [Armatimonadota bacterium]|nr:hypothetical protein [Armatimonadota bacterium]